ncbi:class I SAM-dependent methyltransferase [Micromonospora sp. NPDC048986]|uniref:class I SAM-dependent methyltransferase n=1 Tax=Micromonospora sp. NPDC048986 TaxID=3155644 RepID=UPI0033E6C6D4
MTHPISDVREYLSLEPLTTRIQTHQRYSEVPDDVEGTVRQAVSLSIDADLLDVGCGTGAFLRNLAERGHRGRLVGLDTSPAAVHALSDAAGVSAQLGNAMNLPYDAAAFDVVTARHMLYHVPDVRRALAECRRVLRSDGVFAAVVNCPGTIPRVSALVAELVTSAGIDIPVVPNSRVNSDNLPEMIELTFGAVAVHRFDNALVFDSPEPVIAFAAAQLSFYGVEPDSALRPELTRAIGAKVRAWFASEAGPWRDPKGYVICTARRGRQG